MEDGNEEPNLNKPLVISVYEEVWNEFYEWEQQYSKIMLESLQVDYSEPENELWIYPIEKSIATHTFMDGWNQKPTSIRHSEDITIKTTNRLADSHKLNFDMPCIIAETAEPSSHYEMLTPILSNFFYGDDPDYMPFNPFPEDEDFDIENYSMEYGNLAWGVDVLDPDKEAIIWETYRKLYFYHDLDLDSIDTTDVFPSIFSTYYGERDLLQWRTFPVLHEENPTKYYLPKSEEFQKRLNLASSQFCPNLSCITSRCGAHIDQPGKIKSKVTNSILQNNKPLHPCGPHCFLNIKDESAHSYDRNNTENKALLEKVQTMLKYIQDTSVCELAQICFISCTRMYAIIKSLEIGASHLYSVQESAEEDISEFDLLKDFTTVDSINTCAHEGPCNKNTNCICFTSRIHCEKGCRCSPQCNLRYPGCNCGFQGNGKQNIRSCGTWRCPCYHAGRECDPESCRTCNLSPYPYRSHGHCRNSQIQRGYSKKVRVSKSAYGFGLFLDEAASKDDLILEYVGEIIYQPTVVTRDWLVSHRKRGYIYTLTDTLSIDALRRGNESRFINHAKGKEVNCKARYRFVNRELKIGIYALKQIRAGSELFLDYGDYFFNN